MASSINTTGVTFPDATTQTTSATPSITIIQGVNATQNTIITGIQGVDTAQNTRMSIIEGVNTTQNTIITGIQGVDVEQNTRMTIIEGVNTTQNTNITAVNGYAASAYAKANNALANTSGTFTGDLTVTGNVTVVGTANTSVANLNVNRNVTVNGTMILANSNFLATESAVTISATPTVAVPSNDGYMLHISGKEGVPSRVVYDSYGAGAYAILAGRTARGTVASPTAVANNDVLMRIAGNGHDGTSWATLGVARMDIVATENYSTTNRGSQIQFWNCPAGSNTLQKIASFNGNSVEFSGSIIPDKGFVYLPRMLTGPQTTLTVDFVDDAIIKASLDNNLTVSFSNYTAGKIVEVWLTNTSGLTRTVTHGCSSLNSSENATTFTMPSTSSAYLRYFSIDGDLANTFVSVQHA